MMPGTVRVVSGSVGSWLIAERFAEVEMRRPREQERRFSSAALAESHADRRHHHGRRKTDRS
jgi:hypothetical protein